MHNNQPFKRHHTARYYAQRVRESLTTRVSKFFCTIFLALLFFLGLIAFILWLSLSPHRPRFYIHAFSVPGLSRESGFQNARVTFTISARNPNQNIGIYYGAINGSVYYKDQKIGSKPLLHPFYEEPKKTKAVTVTLSGATLTVNSRRWKEFMGDRARGKVAFRLELMSMIRFKIFSWHSTRHRMHANCDVGVGPDGTILPIYKDKRCPVYFS